MTDELRMQGEVATPEPSADRGSGVARHVGQVSAATFLSRVLGLLRDQVFAAWFGAGTAADAFMLPFLPAVALAAAAMGMLNARGVFFLPALAPALLNVGMIVFGLALIPVCRAVGWPVIMAMAFGVVLGGLLQFVCQLPALHRLG